MGAKSASDYGFFVKYSDNATGCGGMFVKKSYHILRVLHDTK